MVSPAGDIHGTLREYGIELRALKRRVEAFSAGDNIRADMISGVIPAANVPVYWWYNGNLLGAGIKADLIEGAGVWISGTFAAGRAYYLIGAYAMPAPTSTSGVDFAVNGDPLCFGAGIDLQEQAGIWISGTCAAGEATVKIGAYASPAPTSVSGVDWAANDNALGFGVAADLREDVGIWISGTFVAGEAIYRLGAYPATTPSTSVSGTDVLVNDAEVGFARAIDFHEGAGVWISGTFSTPEATVEIGAYPSSAAPTSISGVDFELNEGLVGWGHVVDMKEGVGVWISGAFVSGRVEYEFGAYPEPPPPTSISGVDWSARDSFLGFGHAADFREGYGVWISGSFVGGEALYYIGRYDQTIPTSISGVDIKLENGLVCFGRALDFHAGTGVWISGTCAGQEAELVFGAYPVDAANVTYMPAVSGTDWNGGVDPGNLGPAVDQLAERIRSGKLDFEAYDMWPSTGTGALTDGCDWAARREFATNGKNIYFLAFDPATDEACEGSGDLEVWDGGKVTVTLHWTTVAAAGSTVCWSVSLGATADGVAFDAAFGSAVAVTDTVLGAGQNHICTTAAITVAAAGQGRHLQIRIMRDVSEDNCASNADLIRAVVHYNRRAA